MNESIQRPCLPLSQSTHDVCIPAQGIATEEGDLAWVGAQRRHLHRSRDSVGSGMLEQR